MNRLEDHSAVSVRRVHYLMGGPFEIEAAGRESGKLLEAVRCAFVEVKRLEALLSRFRKSSLISRINQDGARSPVRVPHEVLEFLKECLKMSVKTQGFFDITLLPLTRLWEEAGRRGRYPEDSEIRRILNLTGRERIFLDEAKSRVSLDQPGCGIDLGAAGKGYAVDRALAVLESRGVARAVVSTGSSVAFLGPSQHSFGIRNPRMPGEILTSSRIKEGALATSGNSERQFRIGKRKSGHVLCPESGMPTDSNLLSVTVSASCAFEADTLSTAFLVSGRTRARQLHRSFPCTRVIFAERGMLGFSQKIRRL